MTSIPIPPSTSSSASRPSAAASGTSSSSGGVGGGAGFDPLAEHRARQQVENEMLDKLHASVTMTQHKARLIGREIADQDPMLRQLGDNIDTANMDIQHQNRTLGEMLQDTKERSFFGTVCVLVLIIVLLLWI